MTTTRIDHTNCSHPKTPAARKACRNAAAPVVDMSSPAERTAREMQEIAAMKARAAMQIKSRMPAAPQSPFVDQGVCMTCLHDTGDDGDGYSTCCNDRVMYTRTEIAEERAARKA